MHSNDLSFDLSPDEFRRLGHRVIEMMIDAVAAEQAGPVLKTPSGPELRDRLDEPLPMQGEDVDGVFDKWQEEILPFARRNGSPRCFGYVCTSADPIGMLADALASAMNQPVTAWRSAPAATEIERLVVRWMDKLTGFDGQGGGLLVSGGSSANFHGLTCAITHAEVKTELPPGSRHRLTVYISREGHVSMKKAVNLLGIPPNNLRIVAIDDKRRLRPEILAQLIDQDKAAGLTPAVVCASAGTANTGTIDPLEEIAAICREHDVWFHVDGSYGAPAVLTEAYGWMANAFSKADSLSLDPHKWLFVPVDAGCILVRDDEVARRAFCETSEYIAITQTDSLERYAAFDYGLEMSRRFRALKVWMILKTRGVDRIRAVIQHDIDMRRHLDARIASETRLESLGSELSIACFRYKAGEKASNEALNSLNENILKTLVAEGQFYMSPTTLDGKYALRVCIISFRTRTADIDGLVDTILKLGNAASEEAVS